MSATTHANITSAPLVPAAIDRQLRFRRALLFALLTLLAGCLFLAELMIGQVEIPFSEAFGIFTRLGRSDRTGTVSILLDLRLPRALTAMLAGAGLAVCGLQMQTLFRNALAGPWAMGVTAGAQCGAALVVVAAGGIGAVASLNLAIISEISVVTGALLGSAIVLTAVLLLVRRISTVNLLIFGVMLQFFAGGFVNVILHFANEHLAKVYGSWNEANFGALTWRELSLIGPILVVMMLVSQISGKPLNALLLGDAYARTLGVRVERIRLALLANIVVTAGLITAYCGPVSFIDLVVPHVCRMMFRTSDHRLLLPGVLLLGAVLGTAGDLLVNLPWQDHFLHLNAVLALIGAPVAAWMVIRNRSRD